MARSTPKKKRKRKYKIVISERTGKPLSLSTLKLRMLKKLRCTMKFEQTAWAHGAKLIAGVDEVGRGALFGPVVAAAVILNPAIRIRGLRDSKLISAEIREKLAAKIRQHAIAISVAAVDNQKIDEINIYWASKLAMEAAVRNLNPRPDHLLIDAMKVDFPCSQDKIIHGDARSCSIAAASIIAKVERDRVVRELDAHFPGYGLASNKGYSTPKHKAILRDAGPCPLHRRSFAPVWMAEASVQQVLESAMSAAGLIAESTEELRDSEEAAELNKAPAADSRSSP